MGDGKVPVYIYSLTAIVAYTAAVALCVDPLISVIWFSVMTVCATALLVIDRTEMKKIFVFFEAGCLLSSAALIFIFTNFTSGLIFTVFVLLSGLQSVRKKIALAFAGTAAGYAFSLICHIPSPGRAALYGAVILLVFLLWSVPVVLYGKYKDTGDKLEKALRASTLDSLHERKMREELARQKALGESNARLQERERISRDIHNSVGHTLSAATVTLDAAQVLIDTDIALASAKVDQANVRILEAIDSVRSVVRTLDSEDDTVLLSDYRVSLKELVNNYALDTGVKVHHNLDQSGGDDEDGAIKIDIRTAAFLSSALAELLTNGQKHGGADLYVVLLTVTSSNIRLKVQDNGKGWGDISYEEKQLRLARGFGLRKMADHIRRAGGNIEIDGSDGFTVVMSLPTVPDTDDKQKGIEDNRRDMEGGADGENTAGR